MAIHSRASEELRTSTERLRKIETTSARPISLFFLDWLPGSSARSPQLLACGTCHQEHHGKDFNLQAMDNQTCQGCHILQFTSFADGHPEITAYPYKRRTRIAFDHNSHFGKHFPEKDPWRRYSTCASCHSLDQIGHTMVTGHFRRMCAECHTQELKGIGVGGGSSIPFFRLPELDQGKLHIGEWPIGLYGLEQGITPYMQVLLELTAVNDPDLAKTELVIVKGDFSIIERHGGLYDLADASPEVRAAATRISWAIKGLLFDFVARGQQAMMSSFTGERTQEILGQQLNTQEIAAIAVQLPVGVIQTAQRKWFPNLRQEIASRRGKVTNASARIMSRQRGSTQDQQPAMVQKHTPLMAPAFASMTLVSSFLEPIAVKTESSMRGRLDENRSIRAWLVSSKEAADNPILDESDASILDESDASILDEADASILDVSDTSILDEADASILDETDAPILDASDDSILGAEDSPQAEKESTLTDDPGDLADVNILDGQKESKVPQSDSKGEDLDISILESHDAQDIIIPSENEAVESTLKNDGDVMQSRDEVQEIDLEQQQRFDKEREGGVLQGGWFLQESDFTIRYRRGGHEDKFFQAWLDATRQQSDLKAPAAKIFQNLSGWTISKSEHSDSTEKRSGNLPGSFQTGGCMRCHSMDAKDNEGAESAPMKINWLAYRPTPDDHPATHFAHASHLSLVQDEKACKTCHQMKEDDQEGWLDQWFASNTDPQRFASNFKPVTKTSCSTCHQEDLAGDSCLLCHNYHVGHFPPPLTSAQSNN